MDEARRSRREMTRGYEVKRLLSRSEGMGERRIYSWERWVRVVRDAGQGCEAGRSTVVLFSGRAGGRPCSMEGKQVDGRGYMHSGSAVMSRDVALQTRVWPTGRGEGVLREGGGEGGSKGERTNYTCVTLRWAAEVSNPTYLLYLSFFFA